jgi:hypothetical protein
MPIEIPSDRKIQAASIIVPDADPDITQGIVDIAEGCSGAMSDALQAMGFHLSPKRYFLPVFNASKNLPVDVLLYYSLLPEAKVTQQMQQIVRGNLCEILGFFAMNSPEAPWIEEEQVIHAETPPDDQPYFRAVDIHNFLKHPPMVPSLMTDFAHRAITRKLKKQD